LALAKELELRRDELSQDVETIYFGGGTPSLLTIAELRFLIDTIYEHFNVVENPEITLEANPDDLTNQRINELTNTTINRLSIGVQSFFEDDLKAMNRAHDAREAKDSLIEATKCFDNITIDLIYGIPNMSLKRWDENLKMAFSFGIKHLSSYALTVEPKTALDTFIKKGTYPPIDESLALQHFNHLMDRTVQEGFVHYEISNFGKPGFFSRHNTSYWGGKPYLGIGPSAHSFHQNQRGWNISNNSKYIESINKNILPSNVEVLSKNDQYNEYIMTGLRTMWGVSLKKIEANFGYEYLDYLKSISEKFVNQGLLEMDPNEVFVNGSLLRATKKGKFLIDGITSELFMV